MKDKRVHFIGIGGIGMSGLARLYKHEGAIVTGSDAHQSEITEALKKEGITVTYEQVPDNITPDLDLVVYTEAIPASHLELTTAREHEIRTINYFTALGEVANSYYLIAVAGTHGKSTTTAMLIDILEEASLDPTAIVGTLRAKTGSNYRPGKSKYFVVEACEYKRDFSHLRPEILVITNLEHEHVDYYENLAAVQEAFYELALSVPEGGFIICDTTDKNLAPVIANVKAAVVDYRQYIDPMLKLKVPGLHNRLNAAAAAAAASKLKVDPELVKSALENFAGTWRRFEFKGEYNGALLYDDYAHHPTEIKAAIAGAKELHPGKMITVVFQPHTYTRTYRFFSDFVQELAAADTVILVPIYAAREVNESGVSSEQIVTSLKEGGNDAHFFHTLEAAGQTIKEQIGPSDVVIVMGAGDVVKVTKMLN